MAVMEQSGLGCSCPTQKAGGHQPAGARGDGQAANLSKVPTGRVSAIVQKVQEDPQSSSCLNISYANVAGPVASSTPPARRTPAPPTCCPPPPAASAAAASGLLGPGLAGVRVPCHRCQGTRPALRLSATASTRWLVG